MRAMLFLVLALCGACVAPDIRSPAGLDHRPVARVAIDHSQTQTGLSDDYDGFVRTAVMALDRGDPLRHWVLEPRGPDFADVVVRHMTKEQGSQMPYAIGVEVSGGDAAYVNPPGLHSADEWVSVVVHELEHWAGGEHICRSRDELPDDLHPNEHCSPVGFGRAVLNPYAAYPEDAIAGGFAFQTVLTDLDRAELARGWSRRGGP